jgi:sulfate permease, SulP family
VLQSCRQAPAGESATPRGDRPLRCACASTLTSAHAERFIDDNEVGVRLLFPIVPGREQSSLPFAERFRAVEPKLITVLREGYSAQQLGRDLIAGIIVGIVALPLAIAFAIASGVKPEQGLYTAILAGFLISSLGGSRVQIGGPTGAFIVIVYGIVQQHGYAGLAAATMIAGVLLILMGMAGLGSVIKFIPYPVTVGFTSGIALIIAVSQVRDFPGLQMPSVPADFIDKLAAYTAYVDTWNPWAAAIAVGTVALIALWPRVNRLVPGPAVAIVAATLLVQMLGLPVETIGSRFGSVPSALPHPSLPSMSWVELRGLFSPALTIALLAAIESLLSAVVADGMVGTRHRSNTELVPRASRTSSRRSSAASPPPVRSRARLPTSATAGARRSPASCTRPCCS